MHETWPPECAHCAKFVYCFPAGVPLGDWGYCQDEVQDGAPDEAALRQVEEEVARGDYGGILGNRLKLFQDSEEGCNRFVYR